MKNFYKTRAEKSENSIPPSLHFPNANYLKSLKSEIGARLKEVYQDSGLSQETFARSLGVSKSALNRYISGKNEPKASVIRLLLENFKVNPTWFITGRGPKYFEGVEEGYMLYSVEHKGELGKVIKSLHQLPDLVQILHKLLKTDPHQKETLKAYLMALEMALKAHKKEREEEREDEDTGNGVQLP